MVKENLFWDPEPSNVAECVASLSEYKRWFTFSAEPVLDRRPVITPPPTTNYGVQDSPPTGPDISNKIDKFCRALKPQLKNFIVEGERAIPRWNIKDKGIFYDHVSALRIPLLKDGPSLLLHDLGELAANDERIVSALFFTEGSDKIFCNVSGSGKTRMLLQGLHRTWGFYFVCQVDSDGIGSGDIATAIHDLPATNGWTEPLPESRPAALKASKFNDMIAQHQFKTVLLARLIILNLFLTICEEHQGITDEVKGLWTILQVSPKFVHSYDIFDDLFRLLSGITKTDLHEHFSEEMQRLPLQLICVIDEAQAAASLLEEAFISTSETSYPQSRPVLKSLSKLMKTYRFRVILSGTDISIDKIGTAVASGSMKTDEFEFFHETGSLDDVQSHAAYMKRYLPASLLQGEAGKQLLRRSWHWLRGRYRFTAVFVTLLLREGGRSPHTLLDHLVHHITGYWPNDGMDEWRNQEPTESPVISVKMIYNVEQLQQHAYLLKEASRIVFRFMTGREVLYASHEYPKTWVELGFARFLHNSVSINENLAILSLARWLEEQRGFTLKDFLNDAMNDSTNPQMRGYRFEDVVTFHLYSAFQDFVELKKAFNFICPVPEWASQRARLVTFTRGEDREYQWAGVNSRRLEKPRLSTAPMAVGSSTNNEAVVSWLQDQKYIPIFLPTDLMGPDHVLLMELEDGRHVWIVIQVKFVNSVLATAKLEAAVKTVTPPFFEGHAPGIKARERAVMSNLVR
ncbi:hypothetical protein K439DRAFT_10272 [Ramaria rubella]|nr:hypothetical protein K439DRAFT_10272 [Ramaria rubella]